MFIGHFAVGLASKRFAPETSFGVLLAAPFLLDLLFPIFGLAGLEHFRIVPGHTAVVPMAFDHYPYSHSLLMAAVWGALMAAIWRKAALVVFCGVVSHWFLDAASHAPDMPLFPCGGPKVGLGLWYSLPATVLVESAMFGLGLWWFLRVSRPRRPAVFWSLIAVTLAIYAGFTTGMPPESIRVAQGVGLAAWLFPLWAWCADRAPVPE